MGIYWEEKEGLSKEDAEDLAQTYDEFEDEARAFKRVIGNLIERAEGWEVPPRMQKAWTEMCYEYYQRSMEVVFYEGKPYDLTSTGENITTEFHPGFEYYCSANAKGRQDGKRYLAFWRETDTFKNPSLVVLDPVEEKG
jgi:hypothetical protein